MSWRPLWLLPGTVAFLAILWYVGSGIDTRHFFTEGRSVDWLSSVFLTTTALLAWMAWSVGPRRDSWFWLLAATGFAFLAIDERFQFHELGLGDLLESLMGKDPFGVDTNDIVVAGYGVFGLALLLIALPAVLRYRGFVGFVTLAALSFVLHNMLDWDGGFDFRLSKSELIAFEESCKLVAGASFMLAFLQGVLCRASEEAEKPRHQSAATWIRTAAVIYGLTALSALVFMSAGPELRVRLLHHWGEPTNWLVSVLFGAAALLIWFAGIPRTGQRTGATVLRYAGVGLTGALALDQGILGSARQFLDPETAKILPSFMTDGRPFTRTPTELMLLILLATAIPLLLSGRLDAGRNRWSFLAVSVVLISAVGLLTNGNDILATSLLMFGSAGLLLAAYMHAIDRLSQ